MAPWVQLLDASGHGSYYWNPVQQSVSWLLPEGCDCEWRAQMTSAGKTYYWNARTLDSQWDPPGQTKTPPTDTTSPVSGAGSVRLLNYVRPQSGWHFVCVREGSGVPSPSRSDNPEAKPQALSPESGTAWVEVHHDRAASTEYWNFKAGISMRNLPPGVSASQIVYKTPDGQPFFADKRTGQTAWSLPGMPRNTREEIAQATSTSGTAMWLEVGAAMSVTGLARQSRFNEQVVQISGFMDSRVTAVLPDCLGGTVLCLKPQNLQPLTQGTLVEFTGLRNNDLNGEVGTVEDVDYQGCRYHIKIRDGCVKSVKGTNLIPRSRLWDLSLSNSQTTLQWRKEQNCLFIDSQGYHRRYSLHLPLHFMQRQEDAWQENRTMPTWPMLVYLHGHGGSSFFTHSKKTLKSEGLHYAATHFIVLSPHCDWNWRERPKPWVNELVETMLAVSFVDYQRVYLTGSSMGGMGAWEIAAEKPEVYAAIAPVAAHHQAQREEQIALQLRNSAICAVHSVHDGTCLVHLEEALWTRLEREGNDTVSVYLAPEVDHCSMYEKAYCDDVTLYEWLLRFKRRA